MSTRKKKASVYVVTYSATYDDRSHSQEGVFTSRVLALRYIKEQAISRRDSDRTLFPADGPCPCDYTAPLPDYKAEYDVERFVLDVGRK